MTYIFCGCGTQGNACSFPMNMNRFRYFSVMGQPLLCILMKHNYSSIAHISIITNAYVNNMCLNFDCHIFYV